MVRNWQSRVELADARRTAQKERKQKQSDRGAHKKMIREFLTLLDKQGDSLREQRQRRDGCEEECLLRVWTDSQPSSSDNNSGASPLLQEEQQQESKKKGRKGKMDSSVLDLQDDIIASPVKGGKGSSKRRPGSGKKKSHPRSKEQPDADKSFEAMEDAATIPKMCQHHFFTGKSKQHSHHQKGGNGRNNPHCPMTLAEVLTPNKKKAESSSYLWKEQLSLSAEAVVSSEKMDANENDKSETMAMLYYLPIPLFSKNEEETSTLSEIVSNVMSNQSCALGSIVYVTIDTLLLYDRHREGTLMSEHQFKAMVLGQGTRPIESDNTTTDSANVLLLPAFILEQILTFLPDSSVPAMCLASKPWHKEIGQHSPALWRHLLHRRNWPMPSLQCSSNTNTINTTFLFREHFLSHYAATRDVTAIESAMPTVLGLSRNAASLEEKEMVFQAFSTRRGAPQEDNHFAAVKIWSPKRVLIAYENDCTLRLFEAVPKPPPSSKDGTTHNSTPLRGCREVVCIRATPFHTTKKQWCVLIGMDLDDDMVGCLCLVVTADTRNIDYASRQSFVFSVVSREDFLCNDGGDLADIDGTVHTMEVRETVLDYLTMHHLEDDNDTNYDNDHVQEVLNFIEDEEEIGTYELDFAVSKHVVACGYGRFLLDVLISLPEDHENDHVKVRMLVLFSATADAIVWAKDVTFTPIPARLDDVRVSSIRGPSTTGGISRMAWSVAISPSSHPLYWRLDIEPNGQPPEFSEQVFATDSILSNLLEEEDWRMGHNSSSNRNIRPISITPSDIVVVHNIYHAENSTTLHKSIVSFYPRPTTGDNDDDINGLKASPPPANTLEIEFQYETLWMECIRDNHVVLLGLSYKELETTDEEERSKTQIDAIVIHVPSRKVIHRVCLVEDASYLFKDRNAHIDNMPICIAASGNTIGVAVFWKGAILTGQDVRSVGEEVGTSKLPEHSQPTTPQSVKNQKKKKQKRLAVNTRKSDPAKGKVKKSY